MHSIRLKVNDKIYDKILWLLNKFNNDEIEIIIEDVNYVENKKYLDKELKEILDGDNDFLSVNEVEHRLEKIIKKHEDNL
jgi:hypothetical protein